MHAEAGPRQFPSTVAILADFGLGDTIWCGGTLITESAVLTAGTVAAGGSWQCPRSLLLVPAQHTISGMAISIRRLRHAAAQLMEAVRVALPGAGHCLENIGGVENLAYVLAGTTTLNGTGGIQRKVVVSYPPY